jgi:hypothetical protein
VLDIQHVIYEFMAVSESVVDFRVG